MARGLESWPEKIQYGLFKGWFALEAYSLLILAHDTWDSTLLATDEASIERDVSASRGYLSIFNRLMLTASGVVVVYLCGTALSMLIGDRPDDPQ